MTYESVVEIYMLISKYVLVTSFGIGLLGLVCLCLNFVACNAIGLVAWNKAVIDTFKFLGAIMIQGVITSCGAFVIAFLWPVVFLFGIAFAFNKDLRMKGQRNRESRMEYVLEFGREPEVNDISRHEFIIHWMCVYYLLITNMDGIWLVPFGTDRDILVKMKECYNLNNPEKIVITRRYL